MIQIGVQSEEGSEGIEKIPLPGAPLGQSSRDNPGNWTPILDLVEVFPGNRAPNYHGMYELYDAPIGIQLTLEQAIKSDPLLTADKESTGESMYNPIRTWIKDGNYHMLYGCSYGASYAVSEDGYNWTRPDLGLFEYKESKNNNLVTNVAGDSFKTVFIDPSAAPEERFKGMGCEMGWFDPDTGEKLGGEEERRRGEAKEADKRWRAQNKEGLSYSGPKIALRGWVIGWVSPDGIHWSRTDNYLADFPMDGGLSAHYDSHTNTYIAYCRIHHKQPLDLVGIGSAVPEVGIGRRSIGISRTKDFYNWSAPKLLLYPDSQDDPDISFYGSDYFPYPGRTDLHCMLIQVYHQVTDHVDSQIAFSRDGLFWQRPERRPIIPVGDLGSGDDCMVYSWGSGLIELPNGYWGSLYGGSSRLHNAPKNGWRNPTAQDPQIRWALWQPHRFCGIESVGEGRFTIPTVNRNRKELKLNYRCKPGGWIRVELINRTTSRPQLDTGGMPGFDFETCDTLTGDSLDQVVKWQGNSDISSIGKTLAIRLKMFQAKIFAYQV